MQYPSVLHYITWCFVIGAFKCEIVNTTHGYVAGTQFDDYSTWESNNNSITEIMVACSLDTLNMIAFQYDRTWGPKHGRGQESIENFTIVLQTDEVMTGVDIWSDRLIRGIQFVTSTGLTKRCGSMNGNYTSERNKDRLLYVSGRAGAYVDQITFHWHEDIDNCANVPCLNNGTCRDLDFDFRCDCKDGFSGKWCEESLSSISSSHYYICKNIPCFNGGLCNDLGSTFQCICSRGFTGTWCETDIDDCPTSVCGKNGLCVDGTNSFHCECNCGYTGIFCEKEVDDCLTVTCQNGGSCRDEMGYFICDCEAGYNGTLCETEIKECDGIDCHNGGNCLEKVNGYICNCSDGFTGQLCETDIDECAGITCTSRGFCVDAVNDFHCACEKGFTGRICEINVNECQPLSCLNGGRCIDGVDSFTCNCTENYMGEFCEIAKETFCKDLDSPDVKLYTNVNKSELAVSLTNLRSELKIDKRGTMIYKATKISANDDRMSAKVTGFVLGVSILIGIPLLLILSDLSNTYRARAKKVFKEDP